MRPTKSIRFEPDLNEVLDHLQHCRTCLSRVTAIVAGIPAVDALRLAHSVKCCLLGNLGLNTG